MTSPSEAVQVRVLADLCDAVDPRLSAGVREAAAERAHTADPEYAFAAAVTLTGWLLGDLRDRFGDDELAEVMCQMRMDASDMPLPEAS